MRNEDFDRILSEASEESRTRVSEFMERLEEGETTRPIIFLRRGDLVHGKQDTPINELRYYDFRSRSATREELEQAEMVIFFDTNGQYKFIKNIRGTGLTVVNTSTGKITLL